MAFFSNVRKCFLAVGKCVYNARFENFFKKSHKHPSILTMVSCKHLGIQCSKTISSRFTRTHTLRSLPGGSDITVDLHRNLSGGKSSTSKPESSIFSLSSGHGKCGVAVVRVSGPEAKEALMKIAGMKRLPRPREASLRHLRDPESRIVIDKGITLYFPGPHSFTGEDCVEFQVHGGPAVVAALLTALHNLPRFRQAEPGEFSKRAFLNGKMDLTEVEGLGDLIHAETEVQRRQALRQMDGDLSKLYQDWRHRFIKCLADLEAFLDFGEDQDIQETVTEQVKKTVQVLQTEIQNHVNDSRQGERLRDGVHVVIVGEPNVGKSSLLNAICQRPAAIVTDIAGTTRDVIETHVNIGGFPVLLSDTAGLRETYDIVEKEGVNRAVQRAQTADLKVVLFDLTNLEFSKTETSSFLNFLSVQLKRLGISGQQQKTNSSNINNCSGNNEKLCDGVVVIDPSTHLSDTITVFNKLDKVHKSELLKIHNWIAGDFSNGNEKLCGNFNAQAHDVGNKRSKSIDDKTDYCNKLVEQVNIDQTDKIGYKSRRNSSDVNVELTQEDLPDYTQAAQHKGQGEKKSGSLELQTCVKSTQSSGLVISHVEQEGNNLPTVCCISCVTGEGMEKFLEVLKSRVAACCGNPQSGHPSLTQARHRSHLVKCLEHLDRFDHMVSQGDQVLASEALRHAAREIGKITGKISSEEILDVIFRDFCIGK